MLIRYITHNSIGQAYIGRLLCPPCSVVLFVRACCGILPDKPIRLRTKGRNRAQGSSLSVPFMLVNEPSGALILV
jgi:hypothetical protein